MTSRINNPDTPADVELRKHLDSHDRESFIMLAGAGSGKTTSLVKALDHIGRSHRDTLRAAGQQIACITYTEVAVAEIWSDVGNDPLFHVSTIHSFLWQLAKPFQTNIAAWVRQHMRDKLDELKQERDNFGSRVQQRTRERNARAIERLEAQIPEMNEVKHFTYGTGSRYRDGILGHDDIIKMVPLMIVNHPLLATVIAQKYPFFFIDESQDTFPNVVEALRLVAQRHHGTFTLGFFGDQMQKIYVAGVGEIVRDANWKAITKPENFRCPAKVLSVINRIRSSGDGLQQTRGRHEVIDGVERPVAGTARLFALPADEQRLQNLTKVRNWLATSDGDQAWLDDSPASDVRILVIEHRMAAKRLGFADLHAAFNDDAPQSFSDSYRDGSSWPLKPFLDLLIPLALAMQDKRAFDVISLLRKSSPKLAGNSVKLAQQPADVLKQLREATTRLAELMSADSDATVIDVLKFAVEGELLVIDERLQEYIDTPPRVGEADVKRAPPDGDPDLEPRDLEANSVGRFFACPAKQVLGYDIYRQELSRYSTHQGVKGAEFSRVVVVIDDDESKHFQFSYEKLLGLKEASKNDVENKNQGKETVFERTRRLLYVCCSRATNDLVVLLYTQSPNRAVELLSSSNLFVREDIHTLESI
jgi:DNA helicase-2/ATP-dependent DNA helicase PcrA